MADYGEIEERLMDRGLTKERARWLAPDVAEFTSEMTLDEAIDFVIESNGDPLAPQRKADE